MILEYAGAGKEEKGGCSFNLAICMKANYTSMALSISIVEFNS